ncbi:type II toxin-antitoxin system YoeB family toxin [Megamonas hypermegale]|nr:type II toxin-antitoxin system YoeB family toxin [Megamonas hypermegale]
MDKENRLVYNIVGEDLWIIACRGHYISL